MKKLLSIGALCTTMGLAMTQAAHASQARLLALGLDKLDNEGSYYIDDARNIFLNAANAADYSNRLIFEWGAAGSIPGNQNAGGGEASLDADEDPKAQGGFLVDVGNFVFGAYLGNESNTASFLRIAGTSNAAAYHNFVAGPPAVPNPLMLPTADNQLDLFFAGRGQGDLRWGVNLVYLDNDKDEIKQEDKAGAIRFGARTDRWQAHANISFMNKAKNTVETNPFGTGAPTITDEVTQEFKGKLGVHLGGSYNLNETDTIYGYVKTFKWDQKDSYTNYDNWGGIGAGARVGKQGTSKGEFTQYNLGWGHNHQMDNGGTVFLNLYLRKTEVELNLAQKVEVDVLTVPFTIAYEQRANSWLTLRGSVTQNLYGKKDNKNFASANPIAANLVGQRFGSEGKGSLGNSTNVRGGASLHFGNLTVDGLLGLDSDGDNTGALSFNQVFSRVGVNYTF